LKLQGKSFSSFSISYNETSLKIKSITLENFRSYKEAISIEGLSDVNIFIGPNNVGKSNILEALRYIQTLTGGSQLRGYTEIVFDGKTKLHIHLTLGFSLSTEERKDIIRELFRDNSNVTPEKAMESAFVSTLVFDVVLGSRGLVQEEIKVSNIVDGNITLIKNFVEGDQWTSESADLIAECRKLGKLENIEQTFKGKGRRSPTPGWRILNAPGVSPIPVEYKLLSKIIESTTKWHWFQPMRQAAAKMTPAEQHQVNSMGSNLVQFLNTLQTNDPDEFVRLKNEILRILPHLQKVLAPLRGGEAVITVGESGLSSLRDLSNVSFGLHQILILVFGILNINPDSIVLIEEPELHLHAGSQRKLFELIQKEAEEKQFFITTHSSIFTGCTEKVSTYLVTKKAGATNVNKIEEPSGLKRIKNELGHRNTDLYGYESVVFIEGDSEEVAFPIIAEALGHDLVEKGICLVNIRGKGKVSKITEYLQFLKVSDVLAYVIADGDKQVKRRIDDWIRQGLLQKDCHTVWDLEFEDCFEPHMIINAMKEVAKEQRFKFNITLASLKESMPKGKSVVKALEKLLYQKELPSLEKPALAENLALLLKEEIAKTPPENREKTSPEKVAEKIVGLVEARREEKT